MKTVSSVVLLLLAGGVAFAVPLAESFDGAAFPPEMWSVYNEDGGVRVWQRSPARFRTAPACATVTTESRTLRNDDWLVTRRIVPKQGDDELSFWARSQNKAKPESLEVWVSTAGPTPGEFTHLVGGLTVRNGTYESHAFSLAAFHDVPAYVAFRHRSQGQRTLHLDDVSGPEYVAADVGIADVISPSSYAPPDTLIIPEVEVKNFGSLTQAGFPVNVAITDVQSGDTVYVSSVAAGTLEPQATVTVTMPAAWQTAVGLYRVEARTGLVGDQEPRNDSLLSQCEVVVGETHDVTLAAILAPTGLIPPAPVMPRVVVRNLGNVEETFPVSFRIRQGANVVYAESITTTLAAGARETLSFTAWSAQSGVYVTSAFTALAGDRNPANDSQAGTVEVMEYVHDVGVDEILAPLDTLVQGDIVTPRVVVVNYGDYGEAFDAVMAIGTGYRDTVRLSLGPGAFDTVDFDVWQAATPGLFAVTGHTVLPGDEDPSNDTVHATVYVEPLQGQSEAGAGPNRPGLGLRTVGTGAVRVRLAAPAGARAELSIYDACGNRVFHHVGTVLNGSGEVTWNAPASGVYLLRLDAAGRTFTRKAVVF